MFFFWQSVYEETDSSSAYMMHLRRRLSPELTGCSLVDITQRFKVYAPRKQYVGVGLTDQHHKYLAGLSAQHL